MDREFDKEIDALLRGSGGGDIGVSVGEHIDADAAALFAENLLPGPARATHVLHFAECARCRKLLSGVIAMNSEAAEHAVLAAPVVAEAAGPWYRQLFTMPGLAYVMGGLILVFGGFLALQVLQNKGSQSAVSDVSRVTGSEPSAGGPNLGPETFSAPSAPSNAGSINGNASTNSAANTSTGFANTNSAAANMAAVRAANTEVPQTEEAKKVQLDGVTADADKSPTSQPAPPPPAAAAKPPTAEKPGDDRRDAPGLKEKNEAAASDSVAKLSAETQTMKDEGRANGPAKSIAGPSRNQQRQFPNSIGSASNSAAAVRKVAGKTFEYNDGVWYDAAYRGRPTVNIRRGTEDFRKLDDGLRSIANAITGTVVVVWKEKSYRID